MHMCVCVCPYMRCSGFVREKEPVRVFFGASRRAQCVILCAVVCVGRYRRMQDGK